MNEMDETGIGKDVNLFERIGHAWWDDDEPGSLSSIRYFINRPRFLYFKGIIDVYATNNPSHTSILDVGCGGGYLAEEFAESGFQVSGIDLSYRSVRSAFIHANQAHRRIHYLNASGESLPFDTGCFDMACCCDVLEHVNDVHQVIREISRILRPGGIFFYETVNRTLLSKLFMIKMLQQWRLTAVMEPDLHVWEKFIKPAELLQVMAANHLLSREMRGWGTGPNLVSHFINLRKRLKGKISHRELAERIQIRVCRFKQIGYFGYALRQ